MEKQLKRVDSKDHRCGSENRVTGFGISNVSKVKKTRAAFIRLTLTARNDT